MLMVVGQLNERIKMKVAIGIKSKENKEISDMFARSPYFLFLTIDGNKVISEEIDENIFADQTSSAGIAVIEHLAKNEVEAIICANLGPRALDLCRQLQIKAYKADEIKPQKTIKSFLESGLTEIR